MSAPSLPPITIGVSACLLGEPVRYDGSHKRHPLIADIFSQRFILIPFCPEVGSGLPVPRPPIDLIAQGDLVSATIRQSEVDVTDLLAGYAKTWRAGHDPDGYIVKSRSPSCALFTAPVYGPGQREMPLYYGPGIVTAALFSSPGLAPVVIEAEALSTPATVEIFIDRLFIRSRMRAITAGQYPAPLQRFHEFFIRRGALLLPSSCLPELLAAANSTDQDGPIRYVAVFDQGIQAGPDTIQPLKNLTNTAVYSYIDALFKAETLLYQHS